MLNLLLAVPAAIGLAAIGGLGFIGFRHIQRSRAPHERERRRRIRLHVNGRLTEVTVYHADVGQLHYSYQIAGVVYDSTQDISQLERTCPAGRAVNWNGCRQV